MLEEPKWGPVGQEVYERTYQRVKANGEKETWEDTVRRVVEGNTGLVDEKYIEPGEREKLFDLIYNFKAIPAGRHLWVSGVPGRQFLFNCHRAAFTERLSDHYTFAFDELMKGGGVGANYSNRYIEEVAGITTPVAVHIVCNPEHPDYEDLKAAGVLSDTYSYLWDGCFSIDDSREGWVEALAVTLDCASSIEPSDGVELVFDVSNVREKGARIRGFGGIASGPIALAIMLKNITDVTNNAVGRKLTSLEHMQIDHRIAECVVAGNVRRSARMSIKSWKDEDIFDFIECKLDWTDHWSTNISVEIDDEFFSALKSKKNKLHEHAVEVYHRCVAGMLENGEPGFYNISLASDGELGDVGSTNPCVTGDTWVLTQNGPRQVSEYLNRPCYVMVDGKPYKTDGFFSTGVKPVYTLSTLEGYELNLTSNHKVMTQDGWVEAGSLRPGDKIVLNNHEVELDWGGQGSLMDGYVVGHFVGDGTWSGNRPLLCSWGEDVAELGVRQFLSICTNNGGWYRGTERYELKADVVHEYLEVGTKDFDHLITKTSSDFQKGLLRGLFDTDGHVEGASTDGGISIRLSQSNFERLQTVQKMLLNFGIRSKINRARTAGFKAMPDGRGGRADYWTKDNWRLIITSDAERFMDIIGFENDNKSNKFYELARNMKRGFYSKPWTATFNSLEYIGEQEVYDVQVPGINAFDANGLYVHNCGEIALEPWENCNLGHVNVSAFYDDFEGSREAFRLMTRFLIRATFGDIPNPLQREVVERNRRIGVGFFGFQGWLNKQGIKFSDSHRNRQVRKTLKDWKSVVDKEKARYAHQLRIPNPIKGTTIAPTGSIAKLAGESEGIHPIYAPYFKRRIRYADNSEKLREFEEQGYEIEDDLYTRNTKVVSFYVKDPLVAAVEDLGIDPEVVEGANEISLGDMLAVQAMVQECYADNAVSFTVNIEPDRQQQDFMAQQVKDGVDAADLKIGPPLLSTVEAAKAIIIHYLPHVKGTTIMVDGSRPQSPYERISRAEFELAEYIKEMGSGELACGPNGCPDK